MAKIAGALMGIVLIVGVAAAFTPGSADDKKLEEIRALLEESLRIQRIDSHPRAYKKHRLFPTCDFAKKCSALEDFAGSHAVEESLNPGYHYQTESCVSRDACQKVEKERQEKIKTGSQK